MILSSYYYVFLCSPCGKKFRSKPQIARFLGESADLTAFDFSRAGTPGDGSSRRRARDRTARRAVEAVKPPPPLVRPLSNNPLRPSGPIRRTCGVIKLPVTWISPPVDEELKIAACKQHEALLSQNTPPFATNSATTSAGKVEPGHTQPITPELKASEQPHQQKAPEPPQSSSPPPSVVMVPALWENRLQGVKAYDYETLSEIKVNRDKLQNGLSHTASSGIPNGEVISENTTDLELKQALSHGMLNAIKSSGTQGSDKSVLNALLTKQLMQQVKSLPTTSGSSGNVVPSLLAHGLGRAKGLTSNGQDAVVSSLKTLKENGSLKQPSSKTAQQQSHLTGNIILTLPTMASANSFKTKVGTGGVVAPLSQRQTLRTTGSVPVSNGPHSSSNTNQGLFVSESELRLQEEKVRLLREQLMAAQSTA